MHVEQKVRSFYFGVQQNAKPKSDEEVKEGLEKGRVFVGKQTFGTDEVTERRRQAQEKAMKVVRTAFAGDLELDESMAKLKEGVAQNSKEMISYKKELNQAVEREKELTERTDLTAEEIEREMLEIRQAKEYFAGRLQEGKQLEEQSLRTLSDIKTERAKANPMIDAMEAAEGILAEAGEEMTGLLIDEAKEHLDTEVEKKQEAAEEKAEKEKELEERIEAMKAKQEEKKESAVPVGISLEAADAQMVKLAETGEIVQKELKSIVDQLKLDLNDLKGAAVDTGV